MDLSAENCGKEYHVQAVFGVIVIMFPKIDERGYRVSVPLIDYCACSSLILLQPSANLHAGPGNNNAPYPNSGQLKLQANVVPGWKTTHTELIY
ncbi:hypothetical protein ACGVWS_07515 [Enterobacteriaceae bacterium LUAb1]